jgi:hypothetical protein
MGFETTGENTQEERQPERRLVNVRLINLHSEY